MRRVSFIEKQYAVTHFLAGYRVASIARRVDRAHLVVSRWVHPGRMEAHTKDTLAWKRENTDLVASARRRYKDTPEGRQYIREGKRRQRKLPHNRIKKTAKNAAYRKTTLGKAADFRRNGLRRQRKQLAFSEVFIDGQWHKIDKKETIRIFRPWYQMSKDEALLLTMLCVERDYLELYTGHKFHIDHIQPLSVGGEHRIFNLQLLTEFDNISKSNNFSSEDVRLLASRLF